MNNFVFDPSNKFLSPDKTLFAAGLSSGQTVADLGTGSGFYAVAAAKIVGEQGQVYSVDILDSALDHVMAEARLSSLRNIKTLRTDLEQDSSCAEVKTGSIDLVILANVVHQIENKDNLFTEVYRMLKTGGKLLAIEWNDEPSPIGPVATERIKPEVIKKLAKEATLKEAGSVAADNYHYGLMFIK